MEHIFDPESKIFSAIRSILDLVILGQCWLLCCLTVVLAGPTSAAFYYAIVKAVRRERGHALREFWRAFRQNWKCGILVHLLLLLFGVAIFLPDYPAFILMIVRQEPAQPIFLLALLIKYVLYMGVICWIYPLLSRFDLGFSRLIIVSCQTMLRFLPRTLLAVILLTVGVFLCAGAPILLVLAPGILGYAMTFVLEPTLKEMCKQQKGGTESVDAWYLE